MHYIFFLFRSLAFYNVFSIFINVVLPFLLLHTFQGTFLVLKKKRKIYHFFFFLQIPPISAQLNPMAVFTITLLLMVVSIYLLACHYFRFHRVRYIRRKYQHLPLDYHKAQTITLINGFYELPFIMLISTSFALFKTYGIPTISRLLVRTNRLARPDTAGRRAEDTGVLLGQCFLNNLDSDQSRMCLARINYIHSLYRKSILNDDLLYTLSLFIFEPIRWTEKYEWRSFTSIEIEARFVLWKEVAERMKIENIPSTYEEFERWSCDYEEKCMIFSKDNQLCGEATLKLMLSIYPHWMRSFVRKVLISLIDERLRLAMGFEEAPLWVKRLTTTTLKLRAFLLRHCTLPRIFPDDRGQGPQSCILTKDGRYQRKGYTFEPWYVKETWFNQLCPFIMNRPGPKYKSQGFKPEDLGPEEYAGHGLEAMNEDVQQMKRRVIASDDA